MINDKEGLVKYIEKSLNADKKKVDKLIKDDAFLEFFKEKKKSTSKSDENPSEALVNFYKKFAKTYKEDREGKEISNKDTPCMWYLKSKDNTCCGQKPTKLYIKDSIPLCEMCFKKKGVNKLYTYLVKEKIIKDTKKSPSVVSTLNSIKDDSSSGSDSADESDKKPVKKDSKEKKPIKKVHSDDESDTVKKVDLDDESEKKTVKKVNEKKPTKKVDSDDESEKKPVKKATKKVDSDHESEKKPVKKASAKKVDSDDESDKKPVKKTPVKKATKKVDSDDESDKKPVKKAPVSETDSSDDDKRTLKEKLEDSSSDSDTSEIE